MTAGEVKKANQFDLNKNFLVFFIIISNISIFKINTIRPKKLENPF